MKKLVFLVVSLGLAFGAAAQRTVKPPVKNPRPAKQVVVVRSYPMFSPYFGFGRSYFGYPPFGYGFYDRYRYQTRPTELDLKIQDIQNEYRDRIGSVRHDDDLSRKERREKVRELKNEREKHINEVRRNYYKTDVNV
jgi:hypothetical protein